MKQAERHANIFMALPRCFWDACDATLRHDGIEHAGYLAFLGLLALFPFLVFMVSVIGFLGQGAVGADIITKVLEELPHDITVALRPRVVEIVSGPPQGLLTVSILGAIWTASSAVEGMRTILNRAYHVVTPPAYWLRRLLSIAQLLAFTFVIIAVMLVLVALPIVLRNIESWLNWRFLPPDSQGLGWFAFSVAVFMLFAAISSVYYMIPNIKHRFVAVAPGALMTVVGWLSAAYLLSVYLSHFDQVNLIYGSLGSLIATLIFFYICNMIFILGAEFNYQIVHLLGMRIVEKQRADGSENPEKTPDITG